MRLRIGVCAGALLACHLSAAAQPGALRVAQAATGTSAPTQSGGSGSSSVVVPGSSDTPATSNQPPVPGAPQSPTPPAQQATAPTPSLAPPQYTGTQRNNPKTTPSALTPGRGALPYGNTQTTVGIPSPVPTQPYGGTQRDSVGSVYGDLQAHGGTSTYTGTQSTLGGPQNQGGAGQSVDTTNTQAYGAQPYGAQPYGAPAIGGSQRNGPKTTVPPPGASTAYTGNATGNGTVYTRDPLGSQPYTRDQTGVFGGVGSYDASGVYTGVARQPYSYGQVYVTNRGIAGGLVGTGADATGPLRPFIPPVGGPGRPNSGYGIPNGSKPTYMDARGIQRSQ